MSWKRDLHIAVWGERADTAIERKVCSSLTGYQLTPQLIRKLDFFILTYCCISFFFNYLGKQSCPLVIIMS